jgi:hypothetical protein
MSVTLADFQQRVGQRLGILRAAESLSPEDAELVSVAYQSLWAELNAHGLVNWNERDSVPDAFSEIMVGMTAARLVDEFGTGEPRRSLIVLQQAFGLKEPTEYERRLRRMMVSDYEGDVQELDYY